MFENKLHHTTWFGSKPELIHGIHMIPICPITTYARGKQFVIEEWNRFSRDDYIPTEKSWTSLLKGNQATFDPETSYEFFASDRFDPGYLMDGESRTYYLIYSAMLADSR